MSLKLTVTRRVVGARSAGARHAMRDGDTKVAAVELTCDRM